MIALATSPEPEEAARAREESERLMAQHGLTLSDFEDDVVEIADDRRDDLRQRLAIAVSVSRRCAAISNKRGQIAFRGRPGPAASARELYQGLVAEVAGRCDIGSNDPGRDVWRICYWMGFVDAAIERLIEDEVWKPKVVVAPAQALVHEKPATQIAPVAPVQRELDAATMTFAQHFHPSHAQQGVTDLRGDAYKAGRRHGQTVHIAPRDRSAAPNRSLGSGGQDRAS